MSINDATRFDWDRLRDNHPAIEKTGLEPWATMAEEEAEEEQRLKDQHERLLQMQRPYEAEEDVVNNPEHYNTGTIECIEAIEESMSSVAYKGYLKGNAMKYLWRYDYKGKQVEDLQKCQWYLGRLTQVVIFENEGE